MIGSIRQLLAAMTRGAEPVRFGEDDYRVAAAALLFHATAIDGTVAEAEGRMLVELLRRRFGLDAGDADELIEAAKAADLEAVDLYGFTSVLTRRLDAADREKIIEMMWQIVYADGTVHEFEDNLIWRVAELLGVSTQARIRLKQAVRDAKPA